MKVMLVVMVILVVERMMKMDWVVRIELNAELR